MRRFPQWALAASVLVLTACSPACTPPEAKNPEAGKDADAAGDAAPEADDEAGNGEGPVKPPPGEMITEARGVDLSKLAESKRSTFFQIINSEPSACEKPHSLAKSLRDDATCRDSLVAAQFVADYIAAGAATSEVRAALQEVIADLKPREIPISGRPVLGSERAPVTVVVFADFECPHCKLEAPQIREAVDQFRGRAKLVFKHFPLQAHPRAKPAAAAAEAAHRQGKFWQMHDIIFANQDALADGDLVGYAAKIGLDVQRFKADYKAAPQVEAVDKDRADGDDAGVDGTPAVFVNGRRANGRYALFGGNITGWIDDALKRSSIMPPRPWVEAFAPATVSNLGPGFDCLGLALRKLGDRVRARRSEVKGVVLSRVEGDRGRLSRDVAVNTACVAAAKLLRDHAPSAGVELELYKGLPLGSGLGSSGASAAAAAVAVDAVLELGLPKTVLVEAAREAEAVACGLPHPDNVAPAIVGGIVLIPSLDPLRLIELPVPESLWIVIYTPGCEVKTADARAVLPEMVRLSDAVGQAARLGLLVHALHTGDLALLGEAVLDPIVEPARADLVPGFREAKAACCEAGALACSLSGSGPTTFALTNDPARAEALLEILEESFTLAGVPGSGFVDRVGEGARVVSEPLH